MEPEQHKNINFELNAYIGGKIEALVKMGYNPSQVKHLIVASMLDYIFDTLAVKEDNTYDYYALKPLFVSFKFLIDTELETKIEDAYLPQIQADMRKLTDISDYIEHRIKSIPCPQ